mmetsp:Transcript_43449/g.109109  ORF Transcript_43449/g.109109 Transcript_43449/m.109109 type:complete len:724 (-) Transcript_43449:351-2522(-)
MARNDSGDRSGGQSFFGCAYCHEAFPEKRELEVHQSMVHAGLPFSVVPAPLPEREKGLLHRAPTAAISKSIPLSEVNRHCTPEDCWVALNGKVYDLTEFMDRHPGGPTTILSWAGKDASKMFNDIHKGIKIDQYLRPEASLGDLGVDESLMSDSFWHTLRKARIQEVKEELHRLRQAVTMDGDAHPASGKVGRRQSTSISKLLQEKNLDPDLRASLQSLETQKRVALDVEDFARAQEIKIRADALLAEAQVSMVSKQDRSGGIPLSEVAHHNKPHDCWVALYGQVYDLTDFLLHHPEQRNAVLAWAGRDASPMWNKIPGRFPSSTWMDYFMRPEARMGEVGKEPQGDPREEEIQQLQDELRRLEGPSEEDIQAAQAGATRAVPAAAEASKLSEEARFPRLQQIVAGKELQFFTRAEVAKHKGPPGGPPGTEPYIILHNRVYDLTPLLQNHPGGDDVLLSRAGTDATKDFELFEHSEKSRVKRDQEMLVGEIVPGERVDWTAEVTTGGAESTLKKAGSEVARYLRYKATDALVAMVALYVHWSFQKRKPLSKLTYSRGLRHLHLIMAVGIFGTLGSAQAASRAEGLAKKRYLTIHKQTGVAMLLALAVRVYLRMKSGIPPRFPGHPAMKFIETQSLRLFYALLLVLPVSGMANEYYLRWAPGAETTGHKEDDERNTARAKQAIAVHTRLGKFFEFAWLPFHLGYTSAYHYSRGRGVVRKVSPFI